MLLTIGLIIIGTSLRTFCLDFQDSVNIDRKKIEKVIKTIKERAEIKNAKRWKKDFDKSRVTFSYPKQFVRGQGFTLEVLYNGQVVLMYSIKPDTYELGEITDLW